MRRITSRQNPLVATFRAVARGDRPGLLLDGPHLVAEALASRVAITQAMVTPEGLERADVRALVERLDRSGAAVVSVTAPVMAAVSSVRSPSPIIAVADRREDNQERIYGAAPEAPLVVIACDVQDPGNLGAIVRVAEAAGATGVMAAGESADPFGPKALRGSMGSALRLPVAAGDAAEAVFAARRRGCRVLAAVPRGGRSLFDLDLTGPIAVLIGGEGAGLPPSLASQADECFTIPMASPVDSLNAAVAAALVVYEARRQRHSERRTSNVERRTSNETERRT